MKIFWSWQSDTHQGSGRYFIRDVLQEVAVELNGVDGTDEADRPEDQDENYPIHVDHDTRGIAGSPPIAETILRKIRESAVFVADVTPVGKSAAGKSLANPNVMIELGYALNTLGHERIILVMNLSEGATLRNLPFDLRHWRGPIQYKLRRDCDNETREETRQSLKADFRERLEPCLAVAARIKRESRRLTQPAPDFKLDLKAAEGSIPQTISQRVTDLGIDTLEQITNKTPLLVLPKQDPAIVIRRPKNTQLHMFHAPIAPSQWTLDETKAYNRRVEHYYKQYEQYLEEFAEFRRLQLRTIHVCLYLVNEGTKPGTNIDVEVDIPPYLSLYSIDRLPPAPSPPWQPPLDPQPSARVMHCSQSVDFLPFSDRSNSQWIDINPEQRHVRFHVNELKHDYGLASGKFALAFTSSNDIGTIELPFVVSANEAPEPYRGVISMQIDRADDIHS